MGRQLSRDILQPLMHPEGGREDCRAAAPSNRSLYKRNLKNTDFLDVLVSKVLSDLRFNINQPLKSTDDRRTGMLQNIKLRIGRFFQLVLVFSVT